MEVQILQKEVTAAGDTVKLSDELDRDYKHLTGIAIASSVSDESVLQYSTINTADIKKLPKGFEVAIIATSSSVAPNDKFYDLNEKADGEKIEISFTDGGLAASYPYQLKIYLRLENCNHD